MAIAVQAGPMKPGPILQRPTEKTSQKELTRLGDELAASRGAETFGTTKALDSKSGFPQRLYFKDGRVIVVEYLAPGRGLTKAQERWAEIFDRVANKANGAVVRLAISHAEWEQLVKALSA